MRVALVYSAMAALLAEVAVADVYMHHPRGANNRCDEKSNNRQNAQRMWDSENNAAGGYNFPGYYENTVYNSETMQCDKSDKFYIYGGTTMNIVWTSQHGCGSGNDCNIVLQMGYKDKNSLPYLRDGRPEIKGIAFDGETTENGDGSACTETPPNVPHETFVECMEEYRSNDNTPPAGWTEKCVTPWENVNQGDYEGDEENNEDQIFDVCTYGQHESYENWRMCKLTEYNMGLWTATENLNENQGAMATRQNNNGQQHGFECSEERDYFPYWRKNPWVTFAYLTSRKEEECAMEGIAEDSIERDYKRQYCECTRSDNWEGLTNLNDDEQKIPQSKITCETLTSLRLTPNEPLKWECKGDTHEDVLRNEYGINLKYHCGKVPSSFPNQLGPATMTNKADVGNDGAEDFFASYKWEVPNPNKELDFIVRIRYNISTPETRDLTSADNGDNSPIKDDPYIISDTDVLLRVAVNDNQLPRAFEDRSYVWELRPKSKAPGLCKDKKIYNINVMGKRGNIAQVRNCLEYFFIPMELTVNQDDCVHFQWTGSDYNSDGNDGEGKNGSDRNNVIGIDHPDTIKFNNNEKSAAELFGKKSDMVRLASVNQPYDDIELCYGPEECGVIGQGNNNCNNNQQNKMNCPLLNSAPAYFDNKPMEIKGNPGTYHFISSRNNNFSNRDQKLKIHVTLSTTTVAIIATVSSVAFIGIVGGVLFFLYSKGMLAKATYKKVNTNSSDLASSATRI